jgi:hypothetical protein
VRVITRRVRISSISVESNRAPALCDLGIVVQDDRRDQHDVRRARLTGEDRPHPVLPASRRGLLGVLGRLEQGDELRAVRREQQVRPDQRAADGRRLVGRHLVGAVRHVDAQADQGVDGLGPHPDDGGQGLTPADEAAGRGGVVETDELDVLTPRHLDVERPSVLEVGQPARSELHLVSDGLVPGQPGPFSDAQLVDGLEPRRVAGRGRLGAAGLQLEEPEPQRHLGVVARAEQARAGQVGLLAESVGRGAGRAEDAPLPARRVLARGRPVGVQQVALVEHGVGDRARPVEAHEPTPAFVSSDATVSSQVVSPRTDL